MRVLRAPSARSLLSLFVLTALGAACANDRVASPNAAVTASMRVQALALPAVRIAELHYDNSGTDTGEAIEVSAPAGTDLAGWQLVLYNGNGGAAYNTRTLSGTVPATCNARGVIVATYPSNGIQNGDPDGIALVDAGGQVVEFLSYGGVVTAVDGPAAGTTSIDIGVKESSTTPAGQSLQRSAADTWSGPVAATFGSCNDEGAPPPPAIVASVAVTPPSASVAVGATVALTAAAADSAGQPIVGVTFTWTSLDPAIATVDAAGLVTGVAVGGAGIVAAAPNGVADTAAVTVVTAPPPGGLPPTRFSEIHYDNVGSDTAEAIEVEGPAGTSLAGWSVVLYNGNGGVQYGISALSGTIAASCNTRGVVVVNYPANGIQNGPDGFALVDGAGQVVEFLSYGGTFAATDGPAAGRTSVDIGVAETGAPVGQSLQRDSTGLWSPPRAASFGACNSSGGPPPGGGTISIFGRTSGDPPLPVGFEDQLFATVRDGNGVVVPTTVRWSSDTPALATIDSSGVVIATGPGTAVLRATTPDGATTGTITLATRVATASTTAQYAGNAEFGEPSDGDASNDFLVRRDQFTTSWNGARGTPNWVSYNLEATHFGSEDRCDCFTFDPALGSQFARYTTADYTGAGIVAGYAIDRGHLARSFDRTSGSLDNATTFYFTNIIPQAADQNQGPWAQFESYLGDLALQQNREVYVIAGVAGNKGTVKNEGKIVIPAWTWKVAVHMPRDQGLPNVDDPSDLTVVAVVMPNDPGVRNVPWQTYEVKVDSVEALSGYDVLALLPDGVELAVESGSSAPIAATDGPWSSLEGSTVSLSGAASSDPDGDALTYAWSFGDGGAATGAAVTHVYAQDGAYVVRLIVTDARGLADTVTSTATVANVAPNVSAFAGASLLVGESYQATGAFADPGADVWSATVDYGDGGGSAPLPLTGKVFTLSHVYLTPGTFMAAVRVSDDDASGTRSASVVVKTLEQGTQDAIAIVQQLVQQGKVRPAVGTALRLKLEAAALLFRRGQEPAAVAVLRGFIALLDGLQRAGQIARADAAPLRGQATRVIAAALSA